MAEKENEMYVPEVLTDRSVISRRVLMVVAISVVIVLLDQILKIWVKTHFYLGEGYSITD